MSSTGIGTSARGVGLFAALSAVVTVMCACSGGAQRSGPAPLVRADPLPELRVERLVVSSGVDRGLPLDHLSGSFRVVRVGALVDVPFNGALLLESDDGQRVRVLADHSPDAQLPVIVGETVDVRFSAQISPAGPLRSLLITGAEGDVRLFINVRPTQTPPSASERSLPIQLSMDASDERVYTDVRRHVSFCTFERTHFAARLGSEGEDELLLPGQSRRVELADAIYGVRLFDLVQSESRECQRPPSTVLAYEVIALPGE